MCVPFSQQWCKWDKWMSIQLNFQKYLPPKCKQFHKWLKETNTRTFVWIIVNLHGFRGTFGFEWHSNSGTWCCNSPSAIDHTWSPSASAHHIAASTGAAVRWCVTRITAAGPARQDGEGYRGREHGPTHRKTEPGSNRISSKTHRLNWGSYTFT